MTDFFRRELPHYHPPNATFFVTFRLAGSLPRQVIEALRQEQEREERVLAQRYQGETLKEERYQLQKKLFARYDAYLDRGEGPRWLADPRLADIVMQEIKALDPQHYRLIACCIMSTHVHLLVDLSDIPDPPRPRSGQHYTALSHAMRLLKGRTARACNQILGRSGPFWQDESYDHVVRNEKKNESSRISSITRSRPVWCRIGRTGRIRMYRPTLWSDRTSRTGL